MNESVRLTPEQIEELAVEIREFLLEHDMWQDVDIYFNHKRFGCKDPETGRYFYNDREHLFVEEGVEPYEYLDYVPKKHLLSMEFDGIVCDMVYHNLYPMIKKQFDEIFIGKGVYYEFITRNSLTCYYIAE